MTVSEYLKAADTNMHALSQGARITYATIHAHVMHGHELSVETAKKLEAFDSRMSAADILGLKRKRAK